MAEGENLDQVFDAMGKSGARFVIGQVIGSQTNYFGGRHAEEPGEAATGGHAAAATMGKESHEGEELCHFVHPTIDGSQEWQVHEEIKRLVRRQGIQEICAYLKQMAAEKKILLPPMPSVAYAELVRMGMPNGENYSESTFRKYYNK